MSIVSGRLPNTLFLSLVTIDPNSSVPLYRQIYSGLRDGILDGRLAAGTRLPSTRDLAKIWQVSRTTLRNAFDQLIAEGYLEAIVGHGTFVAQIEAQLVPEPSRQIEPLVERVRPISVIGQILEPLGRSIKQPVLPASAFAVGVPDYHAFPHQTWSRIVNRVQRRASAGKRLGQPVNGVRQLREAIASYLVSARGLRCKAEQVDIVPGSVTGMLIAALAFVNRGDKFWMEDPGYLSASATLRYRGAELIPVPVDDEGIDVESGMTMAPDARVAYVTPSHQYPLGVTLSLRRRQLLLDWAARQNAWIFEDDYDSAIRYDGPPLTALQGLDKNQRVIYFGTFSKILFPDLRLGYVVLPPDLVDVYTGVKLPLSMSSPPIIQNVVAEFMLEGHFVRHIRRMRQHYKARRDALAEAVERHLGGVLTLGSLDCGIHTVGYLAEGFHEAEVIQKGRELGMALAPLAELYAGKGRPGFMIGFTNVQPEQIDGFMSRLAQAIL
ncbi:MAG: PLP-dependent aminotransferase family protein [Chloroflexota bacterium]